MNKETIEQAADVYADKAPESYCNGYYGKYAIADAFEEGARWRIESVWHDVSEIPDNVPTLIEYPHTDGRYGYATTNEPVQLLGSITRWAYLSDLLPDRKEAAL